MHGIMAVNMRPCRLRFAAAAAGNRAYIKSGDWYLRLFRLAWAVGNSWLGQRKCCWLLRSSLLAAGRPVSQSVSP